MNIFYQKIKDHRLAIALSLIFTLAIISPRILSVVRLGSEFKGIYPVFIEDEVHYESRIQDVMNGRFGLGNPYIKEHQDDVFIQPPVAEWVVASVAYASGLSVPLSIILLNFAIIPAFFLLTYALFERILKRKILSALFTSFFFLIFFQTFGRPVSPQLTMLFLLPCLILIIDLYNSATEKAGARKNLIIGALIGLCLFVSPYYWTTLLTVYAFVMLARVMQVRPLMLVFRQMLFFSVTFLPLAAIYAYFVIRANSIPGYADVTTRFGMIFSHWPGSYGNILMAGAFLIIFLIAEKYIDREKRILLLILIASIFILNWQNVLTGQALQFPSHYLVVTILFVLLSSAIILTSWLPSETIRRRQVRDMLIAIGLVALLGILGYRQVREYTVLIPHTPSLPELQELQKKASVFDWLNMNTPKNSVVLGLGEDLNQFITIYTSNKVNFDPYSALYAITDEEVYNRWLIQNIFVPDLDTSYIRSHQKEFWWNRYVDTYSFFSNKDKVLSILTGKKVPAREMLPESELLLMFQRSIAFRKLPRSEIFTMYELDYILLSKNYAYYDAAKAAIAKMPFIHEKADISGNIIYQVD